MRPSVTRTLQTKASMRAVFDYLADFSNTEEWDPGTLHCTRIAGDGGVGSSYANTSTFLGRTVDVTYTALEVDAPTRLHFEGRNENFEGHDVFGISALAQGGSEVRYHAEFSFSGGARFFAPVVALYLPLLAHKTVRQLQGCLDKLA